LCLEIGCILVFVRRSDPNWMPANWAHSERVPGTNPERNGALSWDPDLARAAAWRAGENGRNDACFDGARFDRGRWCATSALARTLGLAGEGDAPDELPRYPVAAEGRDDLADERRASLPTDSTMAM
jgi:hypothetical protein